LPNQTFGAVKQQAAAAMQQTVEAALVDVDVAQAAAEQVWAVAEVVADVDRGDLLDQIAVHLVEVHQFGEQPAPGLRARFGGRPRPSLSCFCPGQQNYSVWWVWHSLGSASVCGYHRG